MLSYCFGQCSQYRAQNSTCRSRSIIVTQTKIFFVSEVHLLCACFWFKTHHRHRISQLVIHGSIKILCRIYSNLQMLSLVFFFRIAMLRGQTEVYLVKHSWPKEWDKFVKQCILSPTVYSLTYPTMIYLSNSLSRLRRSLWRPFAPRRQSFKTEWRHSFLQT